MPLSIEVNNTKLQLPPGMVMELERESPILQFNEELKGGASLPVTIDNTATNATALEQSGALQKKVNKAGFDAVLYDGKFYSLKGKLKVEKVLADLNRAQRSKLSLYFLSDVSDFYQDVKDVKMRDIELGGDRSFDWDELNTVTGTGFWKHIHEVANSAPNSYDYAFYPVINHGWMAAEDDPGVMNKMYYDPAVFGDPGKPIRFPTVYVGLTNREANRIVPFPYLHYVIDKLFEHIGWTVEGDILDDADFRKITMLNFRAIDWAAKGTGPTSYWPRDPVVFNLKDHMPPDMGVGSFLIALKNRFGWVYYFDKTRKKCTIKQLGDIVNSVPLDITQLVNVVPSKNVIQEEKLFALRCTDGQGGGELDTTIIDLQAQVNKWEDLPAADETMYGQVRLVVKENTYYIVERQDDDSYDWEILSANLYDYVPANDTDEITTEAGTVPMEKFDEYMKLCPRMDNQGEWFGRNDSEATWGIHLLFFHGPKNKDIGSTEQYPYASNHCYTPDLVKVADWGLTYTSYLTDGTDVGLYITFFKTFLELLKQHEEITVVVQMPLHRLKEIDFDKLIVVAGVKMIIKTMKYKIPYQRNMELVCWRI